MRRDKTGRLGSGADCTGLTQEGRAAMTTWVATAIVQARREGAGKAAWKREEMLTR